MASGPNALASVLMTVTLFIGGARSGKSSLAVARALGWQRASNALGQAVAQAVAEAGVVFVATGSAGDGEMADRITRHQAERPESWATVEAPVDLVAGLLAACSLSSGVVAGSEAGGGSRADLVVPSEAGVGLAMSSRADPKAGVGLAMRSGVGLRIGSEVGLGLGSGVDSGVVSGVGLGLGGVSTLRPEPALIIDCLSLWVANHLMTPMQPLDELDEEERSASEGAGHYDNPVDVDWVGVEEELLRQIDACFALLRDRSAPTWFVTNEVGLSLVPMNVMGRRYRDLLGRVNAKVCLLADEAFLTVAGRVLRLERP